MYLSTVTQGPQDASIVRVGAVRAAAGTSRWLGGAPAGLLAAARYRPGDSDSSERPAVEDARGVVEKGRDAERPARGERKGGETNRLAIGAARRSVREEIRPRDRVRSRLGEAWTWVANLTPGQGGLERTITIGGDNHGNTRSRDCWDGCREGGRSAAVTTSSMPSTSTARRKRSP